MFNETENNDDNENLFFEHSIGSPMNNILFQQDNYNDNQFGNKINEAQLMNSIFIANQSLNSLNDESICINSNSQGSNSLSLDNNNSKPLETKISSNDVFSVSKDKTNRKKTNHKMKEKAERIKSILKEKRKTSESTTKPTLTFAEKQEKKILRNRMSAQRSRDRQKYKMLSLENLNNSLIEENDQLKRLSQDNEKIINYLSENIQRCSNCRELLNHNDQSIGYISDSNDSTRGVMRNWIGSFSVVGLLCLIGLIMLIGTPNIGSNYNKQIIRRLQDSAPIPPLAYDESTSNSSSSFPIIKYTEELQINSNADADESYYDDNHQDHFDFNATIDNYPLRKHIMEIINKNYPIDEKTIKEKEIIKALREQFLIELFNKIQLTQTINNNKVTKTKKNLQIEKPRITDSKLMTYELPICYNPHTIQYETKTLSEIDNNYQLSLPATIELAQKKQEAMKRNVQTVFVSEYVSSSSDPASSESVDQIDFEDIISKLKGSNSSSTSTSDGECLYFQFLFPVNKYNHINKEEILITSSMSKSLNDRDSLYEIGCKVISISKIGK